MNDQDVIKICNAISECIEKDNVVIPVEKTDGDEIIDGMRTAIVALEKQIPKKLISMNFGEYYVCPACESTMSHGCSIPLKYCHNCGQAIDFTDKGRK